MLLNRAFGDAGALVFSEAYGTKQYALRQRPRGFTDAKRTEMLCQIRCWENAYGTNI